MIHATWPDSNSETDINEQAPGCDRASLAQSSGRSRCGRAAVIGSGFGGLAAAIRLQAMGFETVCYESRDRAGGRAYVYQDAGYTFDAGPTVITAPHCLEELFELAGESGTGQAQGGE